MAKDWSRVQHFSLDRRHFVFENILDIGISLQTLYNDGRTIVLFDGKGKRFCSNFGDDKRLLQYDLRPGAAYALIDGELRKHRNGTETISGYYPSYKHDQSGRQVWIGPKLRFYFQPQEPIEQLALRGALLVSLQEAKLCMTCNGPLPIDAAPNANYCSTECGLLTVEDRERIAREKRTARMMAKKLKEMTAPPPRQCKTCGEPLDFSVVGPNAKYCSKQCGLVTADALRQESENKRQAKAFAKKLKEMTAPPPRPCVSCCKPLDFSVVGPNAKYCCEECKPDRDANKRDVTCYHCSKTFKSGRKGSRFFCSPRCRAGIGPRFPM